MVAGVPILRVVDVVGLAPESITSVVHPPASKAIVISIPKVFRMGVSLAVASPTHRVVSKVPGV
jgi:hypothetical protein